MQFREDLDKVGYAEDLLTLRKELAVAVLHQVKMMNSVLNNTTSRLVQLKMQQISSLINLLPRQHIQSSRDPHRCLL
jgi:hypothetical protein